MRQDPLTSPGALRVLLLSRYPPAGASSRVRFYQYLDLLRQSDISVRVAPFFDADYLPRRYAGRRPNLASMVRAYARRVRHMIDAGPIDLVWIECDALPWMPRGIEAMLLSQWPYVVDYDDAMFVRYAKHPNGWLRALVAGKIARIMRGAAAVTVGNEGLAEYARQAGGRRVEHYPCTIDLRRYPVQDPSAHAAPLVIGWIGSPSSAPYLHLVAPALSKICGNGRATFVAVGSGPLDLPGVPTEVRPWSASSEVRDLKSFDIGIMPLPDNPWTQGKSGYKLLQYMAAGRPVVASPVGTNRQIVRPGQTGLLADGDEQWLAALETLCGDHVLRIAMGRAGRAAVQERYEMHLVGPRLADLLKAVVAERRPC